MRVKVYARVKPGATPRDAPYEARAAYLERVINGSSQDAADDAIARPLLEY